MKEVRYFYVPQASLTDMLPDDEALHAIRVLRLHEQDEIVLMDGDGIFYDAVITSTKAKHCKYEIVRSMPQNKTWKGHLHLAIAPTKMMDRMEWMAEKATEIGFDELSFLNCSFSERKVIRVDRIEKIVVSAMKQSRKAWKPLVNDMENFKKFVSEERSGKKFIAHCYNEIPRIDFFETLQQTLCVDDNITVLVGPEGDFSIDEVRLAIENGFTSISLGQSRLRTETAGLAAVIMMNLVNRL